MVFDPDEEYVVQEEHIYSRYPEVSIYKGKTLRGRVVHTYLRGEHIVKDAKVVESKRVGTVLRRTSSCN